MKKFLAGVGWFIIILFILYFSFVVISKEFLALFNLSWETINSIIVIGTPFIIILSIPITILLLRRGFFAPGEVRMKQFKIFVNSEGKTEAVKIGWSWPAFFFNIIWVLVKKMYLLGIVLLAAIIAFGLVLGLVLGLVIGDVIIMFLNIVVSIIFGAYGNRWRETNLQERGFELKDTVSATTPENAMSLYLKEKTS
jgi:hypothetical protein